MQIKYLLRPFHFSAVTQTFFQALNGEWFGWLVCRNPPAGMPGLDGRSGDIIMDESIAMRFGAVGF